MSKTATSVVAEVLMELISTPNGQMRLLGGIMCVGPAYYILSEGQAVSNFVYAMLAMGGIFILLSAMMATVAAKHAAEERVDQRTEKRDDFPPSERLELFAKEVLNVPRTKMELSGCEFDMYEGMLKNNLYGLLMQSTAKECVLSGIAKYQNGKYFARDTTEPTVMVVP